MGWRRRRPVIAQPGDRDLDCHLTGLRLASLAADTRAWDLDCILLFDTRQAAGSWLDQATGEWVPQDSVTELTIVFGLQMEEGFGHVAGQILDRLNGWAVACVPVEMVAAPGKWTLLRGPDDDVPIPRGAPTGKDSPDA